MLKMIWVKLLVRGSNGAFYHQKNDFPIILFYVVIDISLNYGFRYEKKNIKSIGNNIYFNQLFIFLFFKLSISNFIFTYTITIIKLTMVILLWYEQELSQNIKFSFN